MEPIAEPPTFYGSRSDCPLLDWSWVEGELFRAGTYWIVARSAAAPHPRPVWGVWLGRRLLLSVGSALVAGQLASDPIATVHLDSGTDVVVVECVVEGSSVADDAVAAYDAKYDWNYAVNEYGPLTVLRPTVIMAWRSGGFAGRDGFRTAARWRFN